MEYKSVDDILEFAIRKEEEAVQMYTDLGNQMENHHMGQIFHDFAREELGHKEKLVQIKDGKQLLPATEYVMNLGIADYMVDAEPSPDMDYQQALMVAMKREKASFRLYTHLAAATDNPQLRWTFLSLAQEEAKHKLQFEIEYDDHVMTGA